MIRLRARIRATLTRLAGDRRGSAAMQFGLIMPALFLFVFGIIQLGLVMWQQNVLNFSVAEAARCATVNPTACGTSTQIQSYAVTESGNTFSSAVFNVSTPSCGHQVSATYTKTMNILNLSWPVTLTAQACYPS